MVSSSFQWVVARLPSSSPACASSSHRRKWRPYAAGMRAARRQPVNHRHPLPLRVLTSAGNHDGIEGLARVNLSLQTMVGQQI